MPVFDAFAENYSFWIERVHPSNYPALLKKTLPEQVEQALDAGCGPGKLAANLSGRARRVIALDISARMLAQALQILRQPGRENVSLVQADLEQIPFSPRSFDAIASDSALHDTDLHTSLPALRALLKPGGWLVVRDLVTAKPQRARQPAWQVQRTLRNAPRYLRQHGLRVTLRLLSFELSPKWIRHNCVTNHYSPAEFQEIYSRYYPGCQFSDHGWLMVAVWQAPLEG